MFCYACGKYSVMRRELVNPIGHFACNECGNPFTKIVLPLFIITGASEVGKSTLIEHLQHLLAEYGDFDKDLMWVKDWDIAYNNFFRVASALAQGNRQTVIIGTIVLEHLQGLSDRDLVGEIIYINLHTDDHTRCARLTTRRKWGMPDEQFIQAHARFAAQLLIDTEAIFGHPVPTFDTTSKSPTEVAAEVAGWIRSQDVITPGAVHHQNGQRL